MGETVEKTCDPDVFVCPKCGRREIGRWPQSCLEAVHLSGEGDDGLAEVVRRMQITPLSDDH